MTHLIRRCRRAEKQPLLTFVNRLLVALSLFAVAGTTQSASAQALASGQTGLTACVSVQAHIDLPSYLTFRPNETTSTVIMKFKNVVYPGDSPRVRLLVACLEDNELDIAWDAGNWKNAIGIAGRLSRIFQPIALGNTFASEFSGISIFQMDGPRAQSVTIQLRWKVEWGD